MGDYVSADGKVVQCHRWAPKSGTANHSASRTMCFFLPVLEVCSQCAHSNFVYRIKVGVGHQVVSCPRFTQREGWKHGEQPTYVQMRREACLGQLTRFDFCQVCPNHWTKNPPKQEPGWVEVTDEDDPRRRRKREEEEADELE